MLRDEFSKFEAFCFDLDGVIWEYRKILPGVCNAIQVLKSMGKRVYFVSNNSYFTRAEITNSLVSGGIQADINNVFNISYCAALYLSKHLTPGAKILSLGLSGVSDELATAGFEVIRGESMHELEIEEFEDLENMKVENVEAVVVGENPSFNYYMMCYATLALNSGAKFIGTDPDRVEKAGKFLVPSTGCIIAALETATNRTCTVLGKPNTYMLDMILDRDSIDNSRCVMFGDKMETDILMAKRAQIHKVLMLTGVETRESAKDHAFEPDYIFETMNDLLVTQPN